MRLMHRISDTILRQAVRQSFVHNVQKQLDANSCCVVKAQKLRDSEMLATESMSSWSVPVSLACFRLPSPAAARSAERFVTAPWLAARAGGLLDAAGGGAAL
jgi:hypothetical protein